MLAGGIVLPAVTGHPSQRAGELSAAAYFDGAAGFTAPISFDQLAGPEDLAS